MKFNAANNKERHLVLSVSGQFGAVGADVGAGEVKSRLHYLHEPGYPMGFV